MPKVVAALGRLIPGHRGADRVPQHLACATARLSQNRLELRERVLDGIQVGAVFREEPQVGADVFNRPADGRTLVTRQVVHDDDVARGERRREDLLDVSEETCAVDRTIKDRRGREASHAQRGQKRGRVPAPVRRVVRDARPVQPAAIPTDEVRPDATFIEKQ